MRSIDGMEWPARCLDCGLRTEDPDAYYGADEELMPDGTLCRATGTFHRWATARARRARPHEPGDDGMRDIARVPVTEVGFDRDGIPTDATLERISSWPIKTNADFAVVMDFAGRAWSYPDRWECIESEADPDWPSHPKRVYRFSTGGWSGNESIIAAIEANEIVQIVGAWSWRRGGHYEYRFPLAHDTEAGPPSDQP